MKISIITVIISFILDGLLSNIIPMHSYFSPLCTIVSLILIYPFLYNRNKEYIKIVCIIGLVYDIIYTNTLFLNFVLFLLLGLLIIKINIYISNNVINIGIITSLIIIVYKLLNYIILLIIDYIDFNLVYLFNIIIRSIPLNIIYSIIAYIILDKISTKNNIYKID